MNKDKRYSHALFSINSIDGSDMGRHKLALKLNTDPAPTATDMKNGAGVYRIINGTQKRVFLAYPLSSSIGSMLATDRKYVS